MNEGARRIEILKAEAAIRDLASRMAEAIECTRQTDMTRSTLETAIKSIDELNIEFQEEIKSQKRAFQEERESLNQARESLEIGVRAIQKAQERLEKKADHLENSMLERSQGLHELLDARLGNLSQDINTISNKLLFVMDQNETSGKKILALQQIIEELSWNFQEFGNDTANKSEEIQELRTQVIDSNERLSSFEQALEAKTSSLSHRLRSAIIGGGLGVVMVVMIIKLV